MTLVLSAALAVTCALTVLVLVKVLHCRAAADEILVVTGAGRPRFKAAHLQLPLVEVVDRLDLRPLDISLSLELEGWRGERFAGRVSASAQISRDPDVLSRAARQLLDLLRSERSRIVERVVEAAARGVLQAAWHPEETERVSQVIAEEANLHLERIGLRIDSVRLES